MTEWKPEAGEDAVVRVVKTDGDCVWIEGVVGWFERRYLRPLPTAMSAEDALRDPSEEEIERAFDTYINEPQGFRSSMNAALRDFLARRRSTPPAAVAPATPRDTTALRDAVVVKAKAWLAAGCDKADGGASSSALDAAVRALLAAEAPADPVAEAKAAFAQLEDELMVAPGPVMDRLRAALSALGDRGRG